jgi:hypothetical protein
MNGNGSPWSQKSCRTYDSGDRRRFGCQSPVPTGMVSVVTISPPAQHQADPVTSMRATGATIAEIADALDVPIPDAWLLVDELSTDPFPKDRQSRFAAQYGHDVRRIFSDLRDPAQVAIRLGVNERPVRRYLADEGLLHLALPAGSDRPTSRRWDSAGICEVIKTAAADTDGPLSWARFERWSAETGSEIPAQRTMVVHFGSWTAACEAAGVAAGDTSREYEPGVTAEECRSALRTYVTECLDVGHRPTVTGYERISSERGWPCRNTVMYRLSPADARITWRALVREVMESVTAHAVVAV